MTQEHAFRTGDVVRLKSGGPSMTVDHYKDGHVHCRWFSPEGELHSGSFVEACLVLVPCLPAS
jgi:uncharacterized protein YodC (DUF2158 family)